MKLAGLIRLGRDAELRYTPEGKPVASISAAWNHGRKDGEGRRPTQWAEISLFGERAEKVVEHLTKGKELFVICDDVHVETYEKRDNSTGSKLVARLESFEFTSGRASEGQQAPAPRPAPPRPAAPAPRAAAPKSSSFDDMDDDIPF